MKKHYSEPEIELRAIADVVLASNEDVIDISDWGDKGGI